MNEIANKSPWFDGKITIALLFTFLFQGIGAFIWVGAASQRLEAIEVRLNSQSPIAERLARLEAEMVGARQSLSRIENRLDNNGGME